MVIRAIKIGTIGCAANGDSDTSMVRVGTSRGMRLRHFPSFAVARAVVESMQKIQTEDGPLSRVGSIERVLEAEENWVTIPLQFCWRTPAQSTHPGCPCRQD